MISAFLNDLIANTHNIYDLKFQKFDLSRFILESHPRSLTNNNELYVPANIQLGQTKWQISHW